MGTRADAAKNDGSTPASGGDGKIDRQSARDEDERGAPVEWIEVTENDEAQMTNDERSPNVQMTKQGSERARRHSDFAGHAVAGRRRVVPSDFVIPHSSSHLIATDIQLAELLDKI